MELAQKRMKLYHDKGIKPKNLEEGNLALWYPGKIDGKRKNLTTGWMGPYEVFRIYKNGSVLLRDLQGQEFPERVNIGKLKKYLVNAQIQGTARSREEESRDGLETGGLRHAGERDEVARPEKATRRVI